MPNDFTDEERFDYVRTIAETVRAEMEAPNSCFSTASDEGFMFGAKEHVRTFVINFVEAYILQLPDSGPLSGDIPDWNEPFADAFFFVVDAIVWFLGTLQTAGVLQVEDKATWARMASANALRAAFQFNHLRDDAQPCRVWECSSLHLGADLPMLQEAPDED